MTKYNLTLKSDSHWESMFPYFAGVTFALGKVQQHTYVIKSYRTALNRVYSISVASDLTYVFRFMEVDKLKFLGIFIVERGKITKYYRDGSQQAFEIIASFMRYLKLYEPIMAYDVVKPLWSPKLGNKE